MIMGRRGASDRHSAELRAYVAYRAELLNRLCTDHALWVESLRAFGRGGSLVANWVDADGDEQNSVVNWRFLRAHRVILRGVLRDLLDCGPLGVKAVEAILTEQAALLEEGTFD
jgi:hypothetical protein